jgi:diaminopimelate epimerase
MMIAFSKYQGTGNDFVMLDNREGKYNSLRESDIAYLCHRRLGIGADGLMLLQNKEGYDFEMVYFNADGKEGSMCGNGGRCMVQFARDLSIIHHTVSFWATDGAHDAIITDGGLIELKMKDVNHIEHRGTVKIIDTGSPHYVQSVSAISEIDVEQEGKAIRYNDEFSAKGINVNFIEPTSEGLKIRTYERGVEAETLSCGTGATAAALSIAKESSEQQTVNVHTLGGMLQIKFIRTGESAFHDIWLCGPAEFVFKGMIQVP